MKEDTIIFSPPEWCAIEVLLMAHRPLHEEDPWDEVCEKLGCCHGDRYREFSNVKKVCKVAPPLMWMSAYYNWSSLMMEKSAGKWTELTEFCTHLPSSGNTQKGALL